MSERRKSRRTTLPQRAKYFGTQGWKDCLITEISGKGMRINFYTGEKFTVGSIISLKILVPAESKPVMVKGVLRWIAKKEDYFIGGIKLFRVDKGDEQGNLMREQ
ncbi:MAG: PilZ domain-containing protein [Deltaproteobacteria bacterium]|nr:PilZ domain-containing protein [Deltaproteobacteria bacterium]